MFNISDVMIDKEEISMTFQIPITTADTQNMYVSDSIADEQISVSSSTDSVSKSHMKAAVKKVAEILATQRVSCCECRKTRYILYELSACKETNYRFSLSIGCPDGDILYQFELVLMSTIGAGELRGTMLKYFTESALDEREEKEYV